MELANVWSVERDLFRAPCDFITKAIFSASHTITAIMRSVLPCQIEVVSEIHFGSM